MPGRRSPSRSTSPRSTRASSCGARRRDHPAQRCRARARLGRGRRRKSGCNSPIDKPTEVDMPSYPLQGLRSEDVVLDLLPDDVEASVRQRDKWLKSLQQGSGAGLEFIMKDMSRWTPGQKVRVAFLGGDTALKKDIADATKEITDVANVLLDFGVDPATGLYRTWSETDTDYAAEIRVSFDKPGFF